ncbi:NHLP bacteriocin system secretion protein [Synechococcus sp. RSCCF101]|uniref:NHLP bacteriocin system secretion protein n=1 Tax=Synechococcus sp. RSCCF101 TaxID=2511069 RepID=UPI001783BD1C|nr:NHLP bacteriocin system secretion protein [Synechococcus sp. RSCCF101]
MVRSVPRLSGWPPPRLSRLSGHGRVGLAQGAMALAFVGWALLWPVPTEVVGQGVLIVPDGAGILNARAGGQVRELAVAVGDPVRRGQVLMQLDLPVLEQQLARQRGNLDQLERQNGALDRRDALRLSTERTALDTALAKLDDDERRLQQLRSTYEQKLESLEWLSERAVVAPLSAAVVGAEAGLTATAVSLDDLAIERTNLLTSFQAVKLAIETEQLQRRYRIDDLRRELRVSEARLAFDGTVTAPRDGHVLDLQVIPGQTIATGARLGTIGRPLPQAAAAPLRQEGLEAVAYFAPADARRLRPGLPVEVVPLWQQRGRFGGIEGRVRSVLSLPASEEDISTTVGNAQLARELLQGGPVMRVQISLDTDDRSLDGYRWTLSRGSAVFPVREGLTVAGHAYVEWRSPGSYVLPGLRTLTGGYRSPGIDRQSDRPALRQPGSLP